MDLTLQLPKVNTGLFDFRPANQKVKVAKSISFGEFISKVNPGFQFYTHVDILIARLQQVVDGDISRLMIFLPPRHTKSELVSRLFTAYYLYCYPERWVGLNSYGANLAYSLSRNARDNYQRIGGQIKGDARAVEHWETEAGGGLWAAGVGGAITGKGFHLGIIDDPVKNAEEAISPTIREKHADWYSSTFYTRGEPGNAIIIIQTRWNEGDLSGWLLAQEDDEEPERWHIINFPAIAEEVPQEFPATCSIEKDFRKPGEALCPERYDLSKLAKLAKRVGSYFWNALFQQRPAPLEGGMFKRVGWCFWVPKGMRLPPVTTLLEDGIIFEHAQIQLPDKFDEQIQSWDMTFKDTKTSDYVCGQVWARLGADRFLLDQVLDRMDIVATLREVRAMSVKWPKTHAKLVEDKANGPAVIAMLQKELTGLIAVEPEGGKESRAAAVVPTVESHNVYLPHPRIAPWVDAFLTSTAAFPNAAYDDEVDAMTQALIRWNMPVRQRARSKEY